MTIDLHILDMSGHFNNFTPHQLPFACNITWVYHAESLAAVVCVYVCHVHVQMLHCPDWPLQGQTGVADQAVVNIFHLSVVYVMLAGQYWWWWYMPWVGWCLQENRCKWISTDADTHDTVIIQWSPSLNFHVTTLVYQLCFKWWSVNSTAKVALHGLMIMLMGVSKITSFAGGDTSNAVLAWWCHK